MIRFALAVFLAGCAAAAPHLAATVQFAPAQCTVEVEHAHVQVAPTVSLILAHATVELPGHLVHVRSSIDAVGTAYDFQLRLARQRRFPGFKAAQGTQILALDKGLMATLILGADDMVFVSPVPLQCAEITAGPLGGNSPKPVAGDRAALRRVHAGAIRLVGTPFYLRGAAWVFEREQRGTDRRIVRKYTDGSMLDAWVDAAALSFPAEGESEKSALMTWGDPDHIPHLHRNRQMDHTVRLRVRVAVGTKIYAAPGQNPFAVTVAPELVIVDGADPNWVLVGGLDGLDLDGFAWIPRSAIEQH